MRAIDRLLDRLADPDQEQQTAFGIVYAVLLSSPVWIGLASLLVWFCG